MIKPPSSSDPIRVLHLVYSLFPGGGIESWLKELLRLRRADVHFDIGIIAPGGGENDFVALDAEIKRIPVHNPAYFKPPEKLRELMLENRYDAVHFHLLDFSGPVLRMAAQCDIPVRIAHCHVAARDTVRPIMNPLKALYQRVRNTSLLSKYATHLLACSDTAGRFAFRNLWDRMRPEKMVYCGIDSEPYDVPFDPDRRRKLCRHYGIPDDAVVFGSLGRLTYLKNQGFLLRVFAELIRRDKRYVLFLGGAGELESELKSLVDKLGIQDRVYMPGLCKNVPELICQIFDAFALPSLFEGFGISLIEAAAGGLHSVCSDAITRNLLDEMPQCFTPLSLSAPISAWCDALEESVQKKRTPREGVARFRRTPFTIENSMDALMDIYRQARKQD